MKKKEIKDFATYINVLVQRKNQDIKEDEIARFIIQKCHNYFEEGYIEADTLDSYPLFWKEQSGSNMVDKEKKEKALYYFDKCYLSGELFKDKGNNSINWLEYIYSVKLWERLNIELYDKVKEWEKKELEEKIFEADKKKLAEDYLNGNYYLFKYYEDMINVENKINCKADNSLSNPSLPQIVLADITPKQLILQQTKKVIEKQVTEFEVTMDFSENIFICKQIAEYICNNPDSELMKNFIKEIVNYYYFSEENNCLKFWEWNENYNKFIELQNQDSIKCGKIEISICNLQKDEIISKFSDNTNSNRLRYYWTTYVGEDKEDCLHRFFNGLKYEEVNRILSFDSEKLQQKWKEWYGDPSL